MRVLNIFQWLYCESIHVLLIYCQLLLWAVPILLLRCENSIPYFLAFICFYVWLYFVLSYSQMKIVCSSYCRLVNELGIMTTVEIIFKCKVFWSTSYTGISFWEESFSNEYRLVTRHKWLELLLQGTWPEKSIDHISWQTIRIVFVCFVIAFRFMKVHRVVFIPT